MNTAKNNHSLGLNFVILSAGEAVSKILTFVAFAYLARVLGPAGFGTIELALAIIFIFSQLVDFGTEKFGAVTVAKDKSIVSQLMIHIVSIRMLISLGAFLILLASVTMLNEPWQVKQIILLYGLTLFLLPGLLQWVFQGLNLMHWVAGFSLVRQTIFALLVFSWIRTPKQLWIVAVIEVVAIACIVIFNFAVFYSYFGKPKFRFDIKYSLSIIRQVYPFFLSQMMMALKLQLPVIILGVLLIDNKEVGWFRAAHRIVFALNTFAMLYLFNFLPSIARCVQPKSDDLYQLMYYSIRVTTWSAIFVSTMGTAFAEKLISTIYGTQFSEAVVVLQVMIWLIVLFLLSGHYRSILFGLGQQRLDFRSSAMGAIVSIILCFLLIPRYGPIGAAWAMLVAELVTWGLAYYFVRQTIALIPILQHLIKPIFACLIMMITFQLIPVSDLWIRGGMATLFYLLTMFLLQPTIIADVRTLAIGNR